MATHSSIFNLENPMDTGAWKAAVRGVSESNMTEWLTHTLKFYEGIFQHLNMIFFNLLMK